MKIVEKPKGAKEAKKTKEKKKEKPQKEAGAEAQPPASKEK
jgi:hypothetical protein